MISPGLTKREMIAAMAFVGLLADPTTTRDSKEVLVTASVRYADALLTALEKEAAE